ncbi:MAG: EAL domain-containing protein [Gammaproteobacteria bacterium]|nr:EAL domain-containing protein [Gammaproteobacteria bacterium]
MSRPLHVLHAEDSDDDAELILHALTDNGLEVIPRRVETEAAYIAGLDPAPDLILADYSMPRFSAERALHLLQRQGLDMPFIVISGHIGADAAVALMKAGAHDYLLKHDLARLYPAVQRELREAVERARRRRAEMALKDSDEKLRLIMEHVNDLIMVVDAQGRRLFASRSYQALFADPAAIVGTDSFGEVHPDDKERVRRVFCETVATGIGQRCEYRLALGEHGVRYIESQGSATRDECGEVSKIIVVSRDVTERKQSEARIQYLAQSDGLTGLPNRTLLTERIGQMIAQGDRHGDSLALLFIDLDYFKTINDSLGHLVGDKLLKQVAARLCQCMRKSDFVARLGGDEFLMALGGMKHSQDVALIAQKIVASISQSYNVVDHVLDTQCSVGISIYPNDGRDVQTLMRNADMAMYHAKEKGRNQYQFFSEEMGARAAERLMLGNAMQLALEREEFELHYQPCIELATGRITGVEALIRWRHPELGLLSPARFIPLAEETGLILQIGDWVLRTGCAQMRDWQTKGIENVCLAVNLSARQFRQAELPQRIAAALTDAGLGTHALELEITESMAMQDPERARELLLELQSMGIGLSIDDFGTGYSSLSYLKRFPLRSLKIDRSFVDGIPDEANDVAITRATIALAHSLGLNVIAEGVETRAQQVFLTEAGCERAQGYLFSKPVCAADAEKLLRQKYLGVSRTAAQRRGALE